MACFPLPSVFARPPVAAPEGSSYPRGAALSNMRGGWKNALSDRRRDGYQGVGAGIWRVDRFQTSWWGEKSNAEAVAMLREAARPGRYLLRHRQHLRRRARREHPGPSPSPRPNALIWSTPPSSATTGKTAPIPTSPDIRKRRIAGTRRSCNSRWMRRCVASTPTASTSGSSTTRAWTRCSATTSGPSWTR